MRCPISICGALKKSYLTNNQYSAALIDFIEGETPTPQSGEDFLLRFCSINKGCEGDF